MGLFGDNDDFSKFINKSLEGSQTEKNLKEAFCGESQARNKYSFFAKQARKDGYVQIARIFEDTANNEAEHGKIWLKLLNGGKIPHTLDNLKSAASTENYEWEDMYARFAQDAREEGFDKIACLFELVRGVEKMHMTRYNKLAHDIEEKAVFKRDEAVMWECAKCGYTFEGEEAPETCPFCRHPRAYFFEKCYNY
ncbi:MAG: rubrerythrin family protein [Candidatus Gastranaerophilaceae bacterium]|jgi:hypothetical protein|uniref:Rubrerythrin family protein n=1 Tax=Candidatus Limenecus avicola TaxID=2840847 RepID=A0A9D1SQU2_9CLOT|nr:putative uncharacterized protein [Clostridium sp. CAG:306]DAB24359.1 MAG TPA: rubrerythrin family protein [Candidatus Gastranaerophilales bacterium HUM_21]HIU92393.1 rubrerythrin family protein [Candidatus Limenecus avicola]